MRRDDDLIRMILLNVEGQALQVGRVGEFELPDEDPNAVYYNIKLLDQAVLLTLSSQAAFLPRLSDLS